MADALASGASARKGVWVQVPPSAPKKRSIERYSSFVLQQWQSALVWDLNSPGCLLLCLRTIHLEAALSGRPWPVATAVARPAGREVPPSALNQYNPNLFPVGEEFGLLLFFAPFEDTHFRDGLERLPPMQSPKKSGRKSKSS